MNDAIKAMLNSYGDISGRRDQENALKEVIQFICLLGLHRGGFFDKACFYGGTALRILYGLDRFSEDLDFCLVEKDQNFELSKYFDNIQAELERFGFYSSIQEKRTGIDVEVESAFVKQDTHTGLIEIGFGNEKTQKGQLVKVKLEVDKTNPPGFLKTKKLIKLPVPFLVSTLSEESLFSGKIHALLARSYSNRVKGRDYYDFIFYISRSTKVNILYLENKLRDSGHYKSDRPLDLNALVVMLKTKFETVNFEQAANDVRPFISSQKQADLSEWSSELFCALADELQAIKP